MVVTNGIQKGGNSQKELIQKRSAFEKLAFRGWVFSLALKTPIFHTGLSGMQFLLWLMTPAYKDLGKEQRAKQQGFCNPCGNHGLYSWFLAFASSSAQF